MHRLFFALTFGLFVFRISPALHAQTNPATYLSVHQYLIDTTSLDNPFADELAEHSAVLFDHIHGSAYNQSLDAWLMRALADRGFRYFVVELTPAHAWSLNHYLKTGDEAFLDYVLSSGYFQRTPQDAAVATREKWRNFRAHCAARDLLDDVRIIGAEKQFSGDIVQLANLAPDAPTGIPVVDSLLRHRTPTKLRLPKTQVWSTDPIEDGKYEKYDYLPLHPAHRASNAFTQAYRAEPEKIAAAFGENADDVHAAMSFLNVPFSMNRDQLIYESIERQIGPALAEGARVYLSFGYAHALQESLNKKDYLGKLLKASTAFGPAFRVASVVTELIGSEYLDERTFEPGESFAVKDITLQRRRYAGFTTYSSEAEMQFAGKWVLAGLNPAATMVAYRLDGPGSPFAEDPAFVQPEQAAERKKWVLTKGKGSADYFQYIVAIRDSPANQPYPKD